MASSGWDLIVNQLIMAHGGSLDDGDTRISLRPAYLQVSVEHPLLRCRHDADAVGDSYEWFRIMLILVH